MQTYRRFQTLFIALLVGVIAAQSALSAETKEQRDARMKWWRDAKFGMFIHWGVYAVPAGTYKGRQIDGIGEWIMRNAEIPVSEYREFAWQFNPTKYDPAAWARLARDAGVKYMVITAKHHDGFALYPSDVTDWDVMDSTPYQKDLLGPLAREARRYGLKFGTYYSQSQDWVHPGGAKARMREGEGWDEAHKGSYDDYLRRIAVPQVTEILTRLEPDILWWDTPVWMNPERVQPLQDLLVLRPGLITNNRLGGRVPGDTETPEQHIPATGFEDRDWETCMTMNDTWGFKSYDHNWKSTETLIRNLVDIVSKGGNYLLNVGPNAEGEIPEPSIQRLREIGKWMRVNGDAIYGTTASPFNKLVWGRCTKKATTEGGTLYLHVFDWPEDRRLVLPGLRNTVTGARLLATGEALSGRREFSDVVVQLPERAPDPIVSVIELTYSGMLEIETRLPGPGPDGTILLGADTVDVHNTMTSHARVDGFGSEARVTSWNSPESRISWTFRGIRPGNYTVNAEISGTGGGKLTGTMSESSFEAEVPAAESADKRTVQLGTVRIPLPQTYILDLRPIRQGWTGFDLHNVRLVPVVR